MTRPLILVAAVCGVMSGCALTQPAQQRSPASSPNTDAGVRAHMAFLASDALNGRASGSRDEWIAASYVAAQMQQWGLEPLGDAGGFVQAIDIERSEAAAPPTLSAGGKTFTHGTDLRVTTLSAAKASGPLQKFVAGGEVKPGSVVIMPAPGPLNAPSLLQAAAILVPEGPKPPATTRMPALAPRLAGVTSERPPRPTVAVLGKAAHDAVSALAEGSPVSIDADLKAGTRTQTWNAVGRLTGSDPTAAKEVILLSAHIDHIGARANAQAGTDAINNGADDDASGVIAVLELARALALGPRPKRTIVFAFFGSEEAGGFGSSYFADKPVVPLPQIIAMLQFEMIGRADGKVPPHTLWLTGYDRSTLGPALAKQGAKLVQDPHPQQNFFERSDNIQFARRGVVAHTVSSFGLHKEYHQPSDEMKMIDFPHMVESIQSMLEPVRWLANSGFKPEWLPGKKP